MEISFKQFIESNWDDFFKSSSAKIVKTDPPQVKNINLTLYRGFNLNTVRKEGNIYILSPEKSEQGMLWFTHRYICYYNPIEYAKNHGDWMLTYQLPCKKHFEITHWDDGHTSEHTPEEIIKKTEPTENCRFHMGVELPEGWVFSYKMEKFIGCTKELKVTQDMIQPSSQIEI